MDPNAEGAVTSHNLWLRYDIYVVGRHGVLC